MATKRLTAAIVAVSTLLTACAGRAPTQISVVEAKDAALDCTALNAEISNNSLRETDLAKEEGDKKAQNIAAGVVGAVLFWPALFLMDFQDAAGTERKQLVARDQYLAGLAGQKCALAGTPRVGG